MPFQIVSFPKGHEGAKFPHFMLKKIKDGTFIKTHYKTKESAINSAKNFIRYRKEGEPYVKGNKILVKKKAKDNKK